MAENKEASHRTEEDVMEEKKEKGQEEAPKEREMHEEAREEREGQEEFPKEKENGQEEEAAEDSSEEDSGEGQEDSEEGSEGEGVEKKSFFKRKEKKNKQDEKIAELQDRLLRQMAEFDNFRKRTEKEKAQMFEIGAKSVIEKILPVVDSLERGLAAVPEDATKDPFVQGMDKIYKQLMAELEGLGVKPIEAVGTEFNPDFHNAVMQVESEELESGMVAQEMQKGYLYRDSVVRHSMVSVVQ